MSWGLLGCCDGDDGEEDGSEWWTQRGGMKTPGRRGLVGPIFLSSKILHQQPEDSSSTFLFQGLTYIRISKISTWRRPGGDGDPSLRFLYFPFRKRADPRRWWKPSRFRPVVDVTQTSSHIQTLNSEAPPPRARCSLSSLSHTLPLSAFQYSSPVAGPSRFPFFSTIAAPVSPAGVVNPLRCPCILEPKIPHYFT